MAKNKKEKIFGESGFDQCYAEIYGNRWGELKESLKSDQIYAELKFGECESYFLDPASICTAMCLPVQKAEKILDLCAAPGGKTLVIAGNMGDESVLFSNERSAQRKMRLATVVKNCLPEDISARVHVSCSDGATWCRHEIEAYDSILLDAPCSSERHVLNDEKYLNEWTPARVKSISMEQWALLSSAFRLLKKEGFLLYATCALHPKENDENIQRLLKKFPDAELESYDVVRKTFLENAGSCKEKITLQTEYNLEQIFEMAEKTEFGYHILPDSSSGFGPLFFSLIRKKTCSL